MGGNNEKAVEMQAVHALLDILEKEGVEYIFGIPGGPLTGFAEAIHKRDKIRFVVAKHEGGAAYMAAAHARVRGGLAVCCVTSGPGATNALTGIASASAESLPVLLLTGQVALDAFGKGAIQDSSVYGTDLVELFRPVTRLSAMLTSAARVPDVVRTAIRTALSGRPGPVHLSMPADVLATPVKYTAIPPSQYRPVSTPIDREGIGRLAQLLAEAQRPCFLAGAGVALAGASGLLVELARRLRVPVATSPKGKGVFPENDPLSLGVLGFGGHDLAEKYIESGDVDLLVVIGSSLNEFVTNSWTFRLRPQTALVQLDIDGRMIGRNYPVDLAIVGDARASLSELLVRVRDLDARLLRDEEPLQALKTKTPRYLAAAGMSAESAPLKPQRLVHELREAMPEDSMLFVDNGTSIIWGTHYFEARRPDTYFIDLGLAGMGSAVAGVVGGAMAAKGRRAVALVGDGAFAMHAAEVHTAVEQRVPVVWVVLNNGGLGMVWQGETIMKGTHFGTSHYRVPIDSAAMARAVGANGVRVETPQEFRRAIEEALRADLPTVIDAIIDADEIPPTLMRRAEALASFVALPRMPETPPTEHPDVRPAGAC